MRQGVVVFLLPALLVAGAIASAAAACSSFDDAPEPASDASDASEASEASDGSSASDGGGPDGASCTGVRADFSTGKLILGFTEPSAGAGTLEWNQTEGALAPGSLEAITPEGGTQAQLERDFLIGTTTRARLAFNARLKFVGNGGGRTAIGCTMQLSTEALDGDDGWIEVVFKHESGQILFDQDSRGGGTSIDSAAYANATDAWTSFELELFDITKSTAQYRARVGSTEIPVGTVQLPAAPHHFHIKCGIDSTGVPANVLTDDVVFEMCPE